LLRLTSAYIEVLRNRTLEIDIYLLTYLPPIQNSINWTISVFY